MPLCPSGSSPNPTSAAYAWITWVEAQDWLGMLFTKFAWLMYALKPVLVNVANFCAVEPEQPVYPGDAAVVAALWNPVSRTLLVDYLEKSLLWWEWSQLCQCNASGTPACETQLYSHGSNLATTNNGTDRHVALHFYATVSGLTLWGMDVNSNAAQDARIYWLDIPTTIDTFQTVTLAAGWNRVYFTTPLALTAGQQYAVGLTSTPAGANFGMYINGSQTHHYAGDLADNGWYFGPVDFSVSNPSTAEFGIDPVICVGSPTAYTPTPPDPPVTSIPDVPTASCTTIGDLCRIFQPTIADISVLTWQLNLMQQRLLPFAWIVGTPVTGLTGTGAIAVQDILGVLVSITTLPSGWGQTAETPGRKIPAVGSIQADDGTVYTDNHQVHYVEQIILLQAPWATSIRWNFRPGVVATITPILPEP
jgi:hypothetical protein